MADADDKQEAQEFIDYVNELGAAFDTLCLERHKHGQTEYGKFTFLGNDIVRMMLEELADTANYCRYQAIKLLILQEALEKELEETGVTKEDGEQSITVGLQSFKGVGDIGWGER